MRGASPGALPHGATSPGSRIRLIARDPVAEVDLAVWCHLTGHRFLGRVADDTYLVEVSASASPVREDRPWHLAGTEKEKPMSILVSIASSHDNPDRATVGWVVAVAAAASGQDTTVFLSADGAWVGKRGEAEKIAEEGFAPLAELVSGFVEAGGQILVCTRVPRSVASPTRTWSTAPPSPAVLRSSLCWPPAPGRSATDPHSPPKGTPLTTRSRDELAAKAQSHLDGGGMDCGSGLLLMLTRRMRELGPGEGLLVRTEDASVPLDLLDWSRLAGHELAGQTDRDGHGAWHILVRRGRDGTTLAASVDSAGPDAVPARTQALGGVGPGPRRPPRPSPPARPRRSASGCGSTPTSTATSRAGTAARGPHPRRTPA